MVFHREQKHIEELNIVINVAKINRVESFNSLSLTFDEALYPGRHAVIIKKVSKVIGILYRFKNIFPMATMTILHKSLIAFYLNDGLVLWGNDYL